MLSIITYGLVSMRRKRPFTSTCTKNSVVLFLSSPFCVMLKKTVFYYLFPHSSTSFLTGSRLLLVYVLLLFKSVSMFFKVRLCLMAERPGLKRAPFSKKWCNWFSIPYQVLPRLSLENLGGKEEWKKNVLWSIILSRWILPLSSGTENFNAK